MAVDVINALQLGMLAVMNYSLIYTKKMYTRFSLIFFLQTRRVHWVCFGLERMVTSSGFVRVVPFCCHLATDGLLLAGKPEIVSLQLHQRNNALYKMNVDKKCKIFRLIKDTIIDVMRTKTHTNTFQRLSI